MGTRLLKDLRLLLPAWLLAVAACVLPWLWFTHEAALGAALMFLIGGCALLGASGFGAEFHPDTLSQLLAQPIPRRRVWTEKMLALGLALLPFLILFVVLHVRGDIPIHLQWLLYAIPLCAFCTGPFWSLIARHTFAAAVLSLATPVLIWLMIAPTVFRLAEAGWFGPQWQNTHESSEPLMTHALIVVLGLYCAVASWLGYRKFMRLQLADGLPRELPLSEQFSRAFERWLDRLFPSQPSKLLTLARKEVRLQQVVFMAALAFLLVEISALLLVTLIHPGEAELYVLLPWMLYVGFVPLVVGVNAVAEEKVMGVHPLQLMLPLAVRTQWRLKWAITLLLALGLGVVLPWLCFLVFQMIASDKPTQGISIWPLVLVPLTQCLVTVAAMYAGTLTTHALKGILLAVGILAGAGWLVLETAAKLKDTAAIAVQTYASEFIRLPELQVINPHLLPAISGVCACAIIVLLLLCAGANYRRVHLDFARGRNQFVGLVVACVVAGVLVGITSAFVQAVALAPRG